MVLSLYSRKWLETKRLTSEVFPTPASPSKTSLTSDTYVRGFRIGCGLRNQQKQHKPVSLPVQLPFVLPCKIKNSGIQSKILFRALIPCKQVCKKPLHTNAHEPNFIEMLRSTSVTKRFRIKPTAYLTLCGVTNVTILRNNDSEIYRCQTVSDRSCKRKATGAPHRITRGSVLASSTTVIFSLFFGCLAMTERFVHLRGTIRIDDEGKAKGIVLLSCAWPHMRVFHLTWIAFFLMFFAWFV
jgi:hypothetical protein